MRTPLLTLLTIFVLAIGCNIVALNGGFPVVHAIEEGGTSGGGGGAPASSPGGQNGAHRGHSTTATYNVARWLAKQYGLGVYATRPPKRILRRPLNQAERDYLCAIHRYLKRLEAYARPDIIDYVAGLLMRPPSMVEAAMRDPFLCTR